MEWSDIVDEVMFYLIPIEQKEKNKRNEEEQKEKTHAQCFNVKL